MSEDVTSAEPHAEQNAQHGAEPGLWPATRLAAAIRNKELGSEELLDHFLERTLRLDPAINAVVTLDVDRARKAAREADRATLRGGPLPPLHGLPITVKDALATAGLRSTGGATELADNVPVEDAPAVASVRRAGAIVFGKTNLPRWSGDLQSFNALFGTTNNPWDPSRTPGGSSGGAAAAVAAGLTSFELGTDIGGSIRVPAAYCGIYGHKPSFGLVPGLGYLDHVRGGTTEADVNVIGPLARSAEDLDLLLGILAGPTPDRAVAWRVELPAPRHTTLADYRVAAWLDDPAYAIDPSLREPLEQVAAVLEKAGAKVDRNARPEISLAEAAAIGHGLIGSATTLATEDDRFAHLTAAADAPGASPATRIMGGRHRDWLAAHLRRTELRERWADFFTRFDVLLCPVTLLPPFPHLQEGNFASRTVQVGDVTRPYLSMIGWTAAIGAAYLPVTVPPVGSTAEGLPVGVQIVAPYLEDRTSLFVARQLTNLLGGYRVPPLGR